MGSEGLTGIGLAKGLRGGSVRCSNLFKDLCDRFGSCPIVDDGLVEVLPSSLSTAVEIGLSILSVAELRAVDPSTNFDCRIRGLLVVDGVVLIFNDASFLATGLEAAAMPMLLSLCGFGGEDRDAERTGACNDVRRGLTLGPEDSANDLKPGGVR